MKKSLRPTLRKRPAPAGSKPPPKASPPDVELAAFMARHAYPLKRELGEAGRIILGVSPEICEGLKWNAPSYRTTDWFATANLRSLDQVQFIFHLGAKAKKLPPGGLKITDHGGLIKWLAPDRGLVTLGAGKQFLDNRAAFAMLVQEWIRYV